MQHIENYTTYEIITLILLSITSLVVILYGIYHIATTQEARDIFNEKSQQLMKENYELGKENEELLNELIRYREKEKNKIKEIISNLHKSSKN